ncbi:MAG: Hsp70 family protein, partial [Gammaproteobacteria bacterium]|nr:Hsp70 family protein [Gammaproteobacteria bacterium]
IPSVVYFGGGEPIAGNEAKEMQALGEADVAAFFKRSMGEAGFALHFDGRDYTPVDLSAIVLRKLKANAETALGTQVRQAVITVPAYFNNFQREATIQAGEMAGLEVLRIINEPTAAALAYGFRKTGESRTILVYDLGGGTFDVTLVRVTPSDITVLATDGDHELGGKNWDDRIATYLGQRFLEDYGVDPLEDTEAFNDLLVRCENAKKQLSIRGRARVVISHEGEKKSYELTRQQFEEITLDLMERTQHLTGQVLQDAGISWKKLDGILLAGGSTRMPMVSEYVWKMSGKEPMSGVNADEAVALGAAIQAGMDVQESAGSFFTLAGSKKIQDVMSHSLGTVAENKDRSRYINSIIISKNTAIPCTESRPFQLHTGRNIDNQLEVFMLQGESENPAQCVILGKYTFSNVTHTQGKPAIIDIIYAYDKNGVVTVNAKQRATGKNLPMKHESLPKENSWLSRPPEKQEVTVQHLSVLIAIDLSGSMAGNPLHEAQKAAKRFVQEMDLTHASLGLIAFADKVTITQKLCQNAKKLNHGIDEWTRLMTGNTLGWGNSAEPFSETLSILRKTDDPRFLIVLTDGCWNNRKDAIRQAKQCHEDGIEIIAIGFGGADKSFLKTVATSDDKAMFTNLGSLASSFSKIAQVLTESGGGMQIGDDGSYKKSGLLRFFQ